MKPCTLCHKPFPESKMVAKQVIPGTTAFAVMCNDCAKSLEEPQERKEEHYCYVAIKIAVGHSIDTMVAGTLDSIFDAIDEHWLTEDSTSSRVLFYPYEVEECAAEVADTVNVTSDVDAVETHYKYVSWRLVEEGVRYEVRKTKVYRIYHE